MVSISDLNVFCGSENVNSLHHYKYHLIYGVELAKAASRSHLSRYLAALTVGPRGQSDCNVCLIFCRPI